MESVAENNLELIVLDRPNPNIHYVDGPIRKKEYASFVGMHEVPIVHGMTIGEYGLMINGEGWLENNLKVDIEVIKLKNYNHELKYLVLDSLPYIQKSKSF